MQTPNDTSKKKALDEPVLLSRHPSSTAGSAKKKRSFLRRPVGPGMIIAIILGVIILRGWVIEGVIVDGASMRPTLKSNERLLVLKQHYDAENLPERGQIVIFPDPQEGSIVVKRVIGLPGERIAVLGTQIYVDGQRLIEPYAQARRLDILGAFVPEDKVWVMGDNRDDSTDSRTYGPIALSTIRGRALLVMWPFPPRGIPKAKPLTQDEE